MDTNTQDILFEPDEKADDDFKENTGGLLKRYIYNKIYKRNSNFNLVFLGECGSGKSWAALRLACQLYPKFNRTDKPNIVFSVQDFVKKIKDKELEKGSVIVFDEVGVAVNKKRWWSLINQAANLTFQTMRNRNFITIFTTPFPDFVDSDTRKLIQLFLEYSRAMKDARLFKAFRVDYNYKFHNYIHKKLTFSVDGQLVEITRIGFRKPPESLINKYEKLKQEFQDALYSDIYQSIIEQTDNSDDQYKKKLDNFIESVEKNLDLYVIKDSKGREKIDIDLLRAKTGKTLKLCRAVATTLEKRYALGKYQISV